MAQQKAIRESLKRQKQHLNYFYTLYTQVSKNVNPIQDRIDIFGES